VLARVLRREALASDARIDGPAVIEEFSGVTCVPPGWSARVVRSGHLVLRRD
jgi:5-oxoprolinase (ATP-hydrolysing)